MSRIFYYLFFFNNCFSNSILIEYDYDLFSFQDNQLNLKFYSALDFDVSDFYNFCFDIGFSFLLFCDFLVDRVYYNFTFFRFFDSCFVKVFPIFNFSLQIFSDDFYFIDFGISISPYFIKFIFKHDCKFFKLAFCFDYLKKNVILKECEFDDLKINDKREVYVNSELLKTEINLQRKNFVISSCFSFIKNNYSLVFENEVDRQKYLKFFVKTFNVVIEYINFIDFKNENNFIELVSNYCSEYSISFDESFFKSFYDTFCKSYFEFCSFYDWTLFFNKNFKSFNDLNILECFPYKKYMASDVFDVLNYFSSSIYLNFDCFISYDLFFIELLTELGFSGLICDRMKNVAHFLVIEYFKSDLTRNYSFDFSYIISRNREFYSGLIEFNIYDSFSISINNFKVVNIQNDGWSCGYFAFLANLFSRILDVPIKHSYTLLYILSKENYFKLYYSIVSNLLFFNDFELFLDAKVKIFELLYFVNQFDDKYGDLFLLNRIKMFMIVSGEREKILNVYKKNSNLWMNIYTSNNKLEFGKCLQNLSLKFYKNLLLKKS